MTIFNSLAKIQEPFNKFIEWYKENYKFSINDFLITKFDFQLGVLLRYLDEDHNIGIHADDASYLIYYVRFDEVLPYIKKKGNNWIIEYYGDEPTTIFNNYSEAIIEAFKFIETPF